jgi:hypothetical protein
MQHSNTNTASQNCEEMLYCTVTSTHHYKNIVTTSTKIAKLAASFAAPMLKNLMQTFQ